MSGDTPKPSQHFYHEEVGKLAAIAEKVISNDPTMPGHPETMNGYFQAPALTVNGGLGNFMSVLLSGVIVLDWHIIRATAELPLEYNPETGQWNYSAARCIAKALLHALEEGKDTGRKLSQIHFTSIVDHLLSETANLKNQLEVLKSS